MSALAAIRDDLKERIPRTVERESAKIIALRVGTTPRAVENWRQRESADAGRGEEAKSQGVDDTTAHLTPPPAPREQDEPQR